jgi:hypothetical protein
MTKVFAAVIKIGFGLFAIAVLGLLMSLTYQALARIFPNSFANQIWGLVLFDIAAIVWAGAFVFLCKTILQYAVSAIGFITGFLGTLLMVGAEVILSGQTLIAADTAKIGQWLVYGFIGATAVHVALLYLHHFGAPEINEKVEIGIARSQVTDTARKQATKRIEEEQAMLANSIADEIVNQVKRDLNLPIPAKGTIFQPKEQTAEAVALAATTTPQDEPTPAQVPFPESTTDKDSPIGGEG